MHYTYVLESIGNPDVRHAGHTSNLRQRVEQHNAGKCRHTAK